jgi:Ala-tRNA(Pro) deacylase
MRAGVATRSVARMSDSRISHRGFEVVERYLADQRLEYSVIEHPVTYTAAAEARAAAVDPAKAAKTLMLCDDDGYVIAVIPASETLSLWLLRRVASRPELRLAAEQELARDFPAFEVGAFPPFRALLTDEAYIDFRVLMPHRVLCNGGDHRHSVVLEADGLRRICGARAADICARRPDEQGWDDGE